MEKNEKPTVTKNNQSIIDGAAQISNYGMIFRIHLFKTRLKKYIYFYLQ